jgi:prepilin-type N-terminal cleavage/methylation domain-containing protein
VTTAFRHHGRGGFTLIELLTVVAMISLLAMIAAPRIDYMKMRLNSSASTAALALLAAQREAVSRQHDVVVMIDEANSTLRILFDANNNGVEDAGERIRPIALDDHVVFGLGAAPARPMGGAPASFTQEVSGMPALTFHRNGSASQEGGFYLTSARAAAGADVPDETRAVEVVRATGRAETWRYTGSAWERK